MDHHGADDCVATVENTRPEAGSARVSVYEVKGNWVLPKNREALSSKMGNSYPPEKIDGDEK
jgi:hypothetical protein